MKISFCIISTNNYKNFVQPLITSIEKYFLPDHEREVQLFTDEVMPYKSQMTIIQNIIPSYRFPEATLFRYRIMGAQKFDADYIYYIDADMLCVGPIGDEVLVDLMAVRHPGYWNGGGSWEDRPASQCYVPKAKRQKYFAGGIQGGSANQYLQTIQILKTWIDEDLRNGIKPVWDDESAWNCFAAKFPNTIEEFDPAYCIPEPMSKRVAWGVNHFQPKILALEKPKDFRQ